MQKFTRLNFYDISCSVARMKVNVKVRDITYSYHDILYMSADIWMSKKTIFWKFFLYIKTPNNKEESTACMLNGTTAII